MGKYEIPFDADGNQLDYPLGDQEYPTHKARTFWRSNHSFQDTLTLLRYGRGRSSVTFTLARTDGKTVSVFVSDFVDMVRIMERGRVSGTFTFTKRGLNYGCQLVEEAKK